MSGKALVTGGAGFIGSHLSELLLADGWEVWALDDLSTGSAANVAHLEERRDFHLVVDSVLSSSTVNELVNKCDVVFHLAAAVGVRLIVEQPVHTMVTNVQGTETVLDHCKPLRQARARRLELGGLRRPPRGEARSRRPRADLRADHRAAAGSTPTRRRWTSFLALAYHQRARPRLRDRPALQHRRPAPERAVRDGDPALRRAALAGRAARDPRRRDADALLLPRRGHDPRAEGPDGRAASVSGEIFNVGSTERIAIVDLAERVIAATGSSSERCSSPTTSVYGQGIEDMLHRDSGDGEDRARRSAGARSTTSTGSSPT